ncbi:MAG: MFS transporter [Christensenellaceae bacterium]|jgi:MFS family permease
MNVKFQRKIILLIVAIYWFSMYIFMPYQTPYLISLGTAAGIVGLVVGAYGIIQIILRLPVGMMADSRPRHKLIMTIGVASAAIGSFCRLLMPNVTGFFIGNLFSGIAASMWSSYLVTYPNFFSKQEQQKATGHVYAVNNFGILVGFLTASFCYDRFGMNLLLLLSVIGGTAGTLLAVIFIREPEVSFTPLPAKKLLTVAKDKRVLLFAFFTLVQQGMVLATTMSFTAQVAKDLATAVFQVGLSSAIYMAVASLTSTLAGNKFVSRLGPKILIPAIFFLLVLYCFIVPNAQSIYVIFAAQAFAGLSQGLLQTYCTAEAMRDVPSEKRSTAMGLYQAIYAVGMTVLPMLAGAIAGAAGLTASFYALAVFPAAAMLLSIIHYAKEAAHKKAVQKNIKHTDTL